MPGRVKVFLDTSALFAGIWSAEGGARMILRLGEAETIRLLVSPQVLAEAETVVRRKIPEHIGLLALLLDSSKAEVLPTASPEIVGVALTLTNHQGDAVVLADSGAAEVDFFVTLDKMHFLSNEALRDALPFPIGTPDDCLAWLREQFDPGATP